MLGEKVVDVALLDPDDAFLDKEGRTVFIHADDATDSVFAYTSQGALIGSIEFQACEDDNGSWHHLTSMFLDQQPGYTRQGIGRQMLIRAIECWDTAITANSDDGQRDSWGSHLTGDGPAFVAAMRREGLIQREAADD